jgi:hypothetical protein
MVQVSLVGFAVGGAFLGLTNWDVPYYLAGVTAITGVIVKQALAERQPTPRYASMPAWNTRRPNPVGSTRLGS